MKVLSFMRQGHELMPVEVELCLTPGLPQILFLGLPDAALKESVLRIRSALRAQGFRLPQAQQVLVHLRPTHLRKSSRGLDLAVAAALLWETRQVMLPRDLEGNPPILYGELTLKGQVLQPDDIEDVPLAESHLLYSGADSRSLPFASRQISELKDFGRSDVDWLVPAASGWDKLKRPRPKIEYLSTAAARLAAVVAAGEHSVLMAGPPGSGKTTLAESVLAWLEAPDPKKLRTARRLARLSGQTLFWRPIVQPHHSTTTIAMIGGGASPRPGEITRAHGGVLLLDELLEFRVDVQEALREPLDSGRLTVARAGDLRTFPAQFLMLATTNLCPCGHFTPKDGGVSCRCTGRVRQRSLARLIGPFVDRFAILAYSDDWLKSTGSVSVDDVQARVSQAISFRQTRRQQSTPNAFLDPQTIESQLTEFQRTKLLGGHRSSRRRRASLLRVARTLADLRSSSQIENCDLDGGIELCQTSFKWLEQSQG